MESLKMLPPLLRHDVPMSPRVLPIFLAVSIHLLKLHFGSVGRFTFAETKELSSDFPIAGNSTFTSKFGRDPANRADDDDGACFHSAFITFRHAP